jgi:hypothetical protein
MTSDERLERGTCMRYINENVIYRKIVSCSNVTKLNTIEKYLFKTKCKWENKDKGGNPSPQGYLETKT